MREIYDVRVKAPAKVNLILKVLGRLPNGYHEVWTVMQAVDLFDQLSVRKTQTRREVHLQCQLANVPSGNGNIVYRAAELVLKKAGIEIGIDILLDKQIPMGAGLGGGSSDAAATIFALDQLFGLNWTVGEMAALGAELGSDVPFFFSMPHALIRGWGEEVVPLSVTGGRWILLAKPHFPIETGWAYQQLARTRKEVPTLSMDLEAFPNRNDLDFNEILPLMENDFESALFPSMPRLSELKEQLLALGAETALLSGSGSTMFGIFAQKDRALKAMTVLTRDSQLQVFCIPTGSQSLALV